MGYTIIEMQTQNNVTAVVTPIYSSNDKIETEAVFLEKCAYARRHSSEMDCVSVILLDQTGKTLGKKKYPDDAD